MYHVKQIMERILELPNPAPKGREQEKWKAMVDSVIDFIAASRTMLHVLNDRVKESEKLKQEEKKRLEDEKTKLAFYQDLHVNVKQKKCFKEATTDPIKQEHAHGDATLQHYHCPQKTEPIKEHGDSRVGPQKPQTTNSLICTRSSHHHSKCQTCHGNNEARQVKRKISTEIQSVSPDLTSKETQYIEVKKVVGKTQTIAAAGETEISKTAVSRRISVHHAKLSKTSKIPRTSSFNEEKSKSIVIEHAPNEGPNAYEPLPCSKKGQKEFTYGHLYKKNKIVSPCAELK